MDTIELVIPIINPAVPKEKISREIGGIAYDDKAALYPGATYPAAEDPAYGSEALLIRKPEKGEREESGIGEQHAEGAGVLVDYDNV